ncbi:hypothetical protein [Streptomyces sp. 2A115]|uniref:hypothetical protein n=1 Tax=Streptomyces sp. 2A115 TaxID=3457439 RepID=UPI003FD38469
MALADDRMSWSFAAETSEVPLRQKHFGQRPKSRCRPQGADVGTGGRRRGIAWISEDTLRPARAALRGGVVRGDNGPPVRSRMRSAGRGIGHRGGVGVRRT